MSVNAGEAVGYLDLDTSKWSSGFKSALSDVDKFESKSESMAKKMIGVGNTLSNTGSTLTKGLTAPLMGAGVAAVKFATDFDSGVKKFSTVMDTSVKSVSSMRKEVINLSDDVNISTTELSEGLYQMLSATGDTTNAMDYLSISARLAKGGFTDITTAVNGTTSVMNAYGQTGKEAFQKIADTMIMTQNVGKTTADELAQSLFQVIPTAASLGIKFEEVSAGLAAITAQGTPTSVATTQLRQLFVELSKAGTNTSDTFNKLAGKSFKDFIESGGTVADALALMEDEAKKNNISLSDMFSSVEAGNAALQLTGTGGKKFADALDKISNSAGATDKAFETMASSAKEQFGKLLTILKNVAIELGDKILPYLIKGAEKLQGLAQEFGKLSDSQQEMIIKLAMVAAALGPILMVVGKMVTGVGELVSLFGGMSTAATGATAAASAGASGLAATLGIVGAVVVGVIALFTYLYNKSEDVRNSMNEAWSGIKETFMNAYEQIKPAVTELFGSVKEMMINIEPLLKSVAAGITSSMGMIWGTIKGIVNAIAPLIKLVGNIFDAVGHAVKGIIDLLSGDFDGFVENLKGGLSAAGEGIKNLFSVLKEFFGGLFSGIWEALVSGMKMCGIDLEKVFQDIGNGIKNVWDNIMSFFTETIPEKFNEVVGFFTGLGDDIKECLSNMGKSLVEFVTVTIPDFINNVVNFFKELPYKVGEALGELTNNIYNFGKDLWNWCTTEIPKFIDNMVNFFKELPGKIWTFLEETISKIAEFGSNLIEKGISIGTEFIDNVVRFFKELPGKIATTLTDAFNAVKNWGKDTVDKGVESGTKFVNSIVDWLKKLPGEFKKWFDDVISYVSSLPSKFTEWGGKILSGLWDGLKSKWEDIKSWFQGIGDWLGGFFDGFLDGFNGGQKSSKGSYATGLQYVQQDNTRITVHEGEAVLTAEENREYRSGAGKGVQVYVNAQISNDMDLDRVGKVLGYEVDKAIRYGVT